MLMIIIKFNHNIKQVRLCIASQFFYSKFCKNKNLFALFLSSLFLFCKNLTIHLLSMSVLHFQSEFLPTRFYMMKHLYVTGFSVNNQDICCRSSNNFDKKVVLLDLFHFMESNNVTQCFEIQFYLGDHINLKQNTKKE